MKVLLQVQRRLKTQLWWFVTLTVILTVMEVTSLSGPNVCMVNQKYNITKRVKYRAPMSVRTYEWCFAVPPRCSKWTTEMRDVTRLETEERTAEMAVCCPGYKLKDVYCVPICPNGKTGHGCSEDCPPNKWGPNCVNDCKKCDHGACDAATGECRCLDGWQGESCETSMSTTAAVAMMEQLLTTVRTIASTKTTEQTIPTVNMSSTTIATASSTMAYVNTTSSPVITSSIPTTSIAISDKNFTQSTTQSVPTVFTTENIQVSSTEATTPTRAVFLFSNNVTLSSYPTTLDTYKIITENDYKRQILDNMNFSRSGTELSSTSTTYTPTPIETTTAMILDESTIRKIQETQAERTTSKPSTRATLTIKSTQPTTTTALTTLKEATVTKETQETRRTETTVKQSSTTKFKPREIWIRPAQKGESPFIETKLKANQELSHTSKAKEFIEVTTPKTIIVSIIPTSVSYVIFKKIALSTAPSIPQKNNHLTTKFIRKSTNQGYTKSMVLQTTASPQTVKNQPIKSPAPPTFNTLLTTNVTKNKQYAFTTGRTLETTVSTIQTTNSMSSTLNAANKRLNSSSLTQVPSFPTNVTRTTPKYNAPETNTSKILNTTPSNNLTSSSTEKATTEHLSTRKQSVTIMHTSTTGKLIETAYTEVPKVTKTLVQNEFDTKNKNLTTTTSITVTNNPLKDEETFHILTEPEHITAVMGDKETERSTIDLISVISIAGGVMMAIITVAVLIVMLERCKKPRYEEVRKYNDINMQVMIDNNDIPPPYVRSIFHTPLPDPPTSEKCHYQPISTLDRNLKQFMRPVVVQTISPLMLENFRGILECHYDHLPRRSEDMGTLPARCSVTPSINDTTELLPRRGHSLTDSDIEALKCEAKLDVIDNTTSEPLYAEIPCWRPPSAHAIEVVNVNGEAVTEL